MRRLVVLIFMIGLYGCGVLVTKVVHPASTRGHETRVPVQPIPNSFSTETFNRKDGKNRTFFLSERKNAKGTILYLHGNGVVAQNTLPKLGFLSDFGFDVAVMEYTGYGPHSGRPTENALRKDVLGMVAHIKERQPNLPILMVGSSLGGSLAIISAQDAGVDGLVTLAAFTRATDFSQKWADQIVERQNAFDALDAAAELTIPWTIVHCTGDPTVPASMAERLYLARRFAIGDQGLQKMVRDCDSHLIPFPIWRNAVDSVIKQLPLRVQ